MIPDFGEHRLNPLTTLVVAVAMLATAACGGSGGPSGANADPAHDGLRVVATTSIVGDIVANVVADAGSVEVLLPPGTDPHEFSPSASDAALLGEADVVVANGLGLEEGLERALRAAEADGTRVFELASGYTDILEASEPAGEHNDGAHNPDEHEGDNREGGDPHIWFDPRQMAQAVLSLGEELAAVAGNDEVRDRARAYRDDLLATDAEVADILAAVPPARRVLVTNHDNLGYLAERYGFEIAGAAIPSTSSNAESSAGQLARLAEVVRAEQVPAVFADNAGDDSLVRTLAAEAGRELQVVPLLTDALAPAGEEGDTYLSLLTVNARRIADALT